MDSDRRNLHPLLQMLLMTFPEALEYDSDMSLTVVDREFFGDRLGLGLGEPARPITTCRTCSEAPVRYQGEQCTGCRELERQEAARARSPQQLPPARPDRPARTSLAARAPMDAPLPTPLALVPKAQHEPQPQPQPQPHPLPTTEPRPQGPEPLVIGGAVEGEVAPEIPDSASEIEAFLAAGIPESVPVVLHQNVLDLYGVDLEFAISTIRNPQAVSIDSTMRRRDYPVLRFRRGDLYVVVGFKARQRPAILGVYVNALLEPDAHQAPTGSGGGGSKQKTLGKPRTIVALVKRLRMLNITLGEPNDAGTAEATYHDQSLGRVQVLGVASRLEVESSWDRMQRKVHAIERREAG